MAKPKTIQINSAGQAMTEMIIVIPLLFLLAAGMIQFTFLFIAKVSFEHACGQAARDYASKKIDPTLLSVDIWKNLGSEQGFFIQETLLTVPLPTTSIIGQNFLNQTSILGPLITKIKSSLLNYSGQKWTVIIFFKSIPLFGVIFPEGIPFRTEMAVLKYPDQD